MRSSTQPRQRRPPTPPPSLRAKSSSSSSSSSSNGRHPLRSVARVGTWHEVVEEGGERLDAREDYNAWYPSRKKRPPPVMAWLLELGADVTLRDGNGDCAVHWACEGRYASILALLIATGAPLTNDSQMPLTTRGGDVSELHAAADEEGWTPRPRRIYPHVAAAGGARRDGG